MRLAVGVALVAAVVSGCAMAESEANVPDHITFSTAAPGEMTAAARDILATLPPDKAEEHYGVVVSVSPRDTWYARVIARGGVVVLYQGPCTDGWGNGSYETDDWLRQFAMPGDAVAWTSKTNELCPDQLRVVDPGAALLTATSR